MENPQDHDAVGVNLILQHIGRTERMGCKLAIRLMPADRSPQVRMFAQLL